LIIFMVAAPLLQVGVPIELPEAKGKQLQSSKEPLAITVKSDGTVYIGESLVPLNEVAEAQRQSRNEQQFGSVAPGVLQYTTDVLFRDLWLRPNLAPRDRSLVTVSALIATGQVAQISYHLNRAMDNGLTQAQAAEVLTHLAFYVGWPNVFSALPVAKDVFEKRPKDADLLVPAVQKHERQFGRVPQLVAGDAGFYSTGNEAELQKMGVRQISVPNHLTRSPERRRHQKRRSFRRGQKWRTGAEGRISVLKRRHGLNRCRYRGEAGMQRWVGLGVIADNLINIGRFMVATRSG